MSEGRAAVPAWTMRRATLADREATFELTRRAFGQEAVDPTAGPIWDWIFRRNPSRARMHYLVADAGDRLAGQYAVMPIRMQHAGRRMLGLLSLHTATDPDFQRQGILTKLAAELYAQAANEAPIVYGFPNPISAPRLFRNLEWVDLGALPLLVRPIGGIREPVRHWRPQFERVAAAVDLFSPLLRVTGEALGRLGADRTAELQPFDRFGDWADALWEELAPALGTCAVRDAAMLQWRYCDSPFPYRRWALVREGRPVGFAVSTLEVWRGARLGRLMELMVPASDAAGARLLVAEVIRDAVREGAFAITTIASRRHPHRRVMLQAGLLPVPAALAPGGGFGVRHNGPGAVPDQLFHPGDWYISGTDLDYV